MGTNETLKTLLQNVASLEEGIDNVKIVVEIDPDALPAASAGAPPFTGVLTRQVLSSGKVVVRWLPDADGASMSEELREPNQEEKEFWQDRLGIDSQDGIDIDTGIALLRVESPGTDNTVAWVPYDANQAPIISVLPAADGAGTGLQEFVDCLRQESNTSDKLTKCWNLHMTF